MKASIRRGPLAGTAAILGRAHRPRRSGPIRRVAAVERELTEECLDRVVLPEPFGPTSATPVGPIDVEGERSEYEVASCGSRASGESETRRLPTGSLARSKSAGPIPPTASRQRLERLDRPFGPPCPPKRAARSGSSGSPAATGRCPSALLLLLPRRDVAHWRSGCARPCSSVRRCLVDREGLVRVGPVGRALGAERRSHRRRGDPPWSCSSTSSDGGHRLTKEGPVVAHDATPPRGRATNCSSRAEAVEVEVVRRLVEERDVEAAEEDPRPGATRAAWPPDSVATGWSARGAGRPICPRVVIRAASRSRRRGDRLVAGRAPRRSGRRPAPLRRVPAAAAVERSASAAASTGAAGYSAAVRSRGARPWMLLAQVADRSRSGGCDPDLAAAGSSSPARICRRVDLPTPLGPTTPRQVVGPTVSDTSSRTTRPPRSWRR